MMNIQGAKFEGHKSNRVFENYNGTSRPPALRRTQSSRLLQESGMKDEVTIHVFDEGRKTSKYFFCQRNVLISQMKYFESFLAENEGNSDLDISVYCDIEIFEWLMNYIHEPSSKPYLDKSIVVSILISSEFLQMDELVNICLESIAGRLDDIIALPIDLSCISDKLVNMLATLTHPKTLSKTKDRKDKILNKLYKRRVELDFSRRGGFKSNSGTFSRSIATSLTCCEYCGVVYLENYVTLLTCKISPSTISYRGNICKRHSSITGWSLTSYLKTLHCGGMDWESIYWHVWAACIVLKPPKGQIIRIGNREENDDFVISGLDVDRYSFEDLGLLILDRPNTENFQNDNIDEKLRVNSEFQNNNEIRTFSLSDKNDNKAEVLSYKMPYIDDLLIDYQSNLDSDNHHHHHLSNEHKGNIKQNNEYFNHTDMSGDHYKKNTTYNNNNIQSFTSSLNPSRTPDTLPVEIFELLESQAYFIRGIQFKELISRTAHAIVQNIIIPFSYSLPAILKSTSQSNISTLHHSHTFKWIGTEKNIDYAEILWGDSEARSKILALRNATAASPQRGDDMILSSSIGTGYDLPDNTKERGRARSVGKGRRLIRSHSKNGTAGTGPMRVSPTDIPRNRSSTRSKSDSKIDYENDTDQWEIQKGRRIRTSISKDPMVGSGSCSATDENDLRITQDGSCRKECIKLMNDNLLIISALPKNMKNIIEDGKGSYDDFWFTFHPLQSHPLSVTELLKSVTEPNKQGIILSNEKQLMWYMDLVRDSDDQRMARYESFLSSKRNPSIDDQLKIRPKNLILPNTSNLQQKLSRKQKNILTNDYYKDKGRQANK